MYTLTESEREQLKIHSEHMRDINAMPVAELSLAISEDRCPYQPTTLRGLKMEVQDCPLCGVRVHPGLPHPRKSDEAFTEEELAKLAGAGSNVDQMEI